MPPLLRARAEHRAHSIGEFSSRLHALHRTNVIGAPRRSTPDPYGRPPARSSRPSAARPSAQTVRRRREVLFVLGAAAIVTFLIAFKLGGFGFWLLHLSVDAAIGAYLYALSRLAAAATARSAAPVRYLAPSRPAPEYAYQRRSAHS